MPVDHLYVFFAEMSRSPAHFFIGLFVLQFLGCIKYLYTLESKPMSVSSFANIFSQSVGCLFILFMLSFTVQKLISLSPSCLFLLLFLLP